MPRRQLWAVLWRTALVAGLLSLALGLGLGLAARIASATPGTGATAAWLAKLGPFAGTYLTAGLALLLLAPAIGVLDYGTRAFWDDLRESVRIAAAQIRANKARSALTALGVVIGIVAVTLMGTAIAGIDAGVDQSFAGFGDDQLYVSRKPWNAWDDWATYRNRRPIQTTYADQINDWIATRPASALKLAVPAPNTFSNAVRGDLRVNNLWLMGVSADYPRMTRSDMAEGRFFNEIEVQAARNVAVIGYDIADALFPVGGAVGQNIRVGGRIFQVVGVATKQGSFLGAWSWDTQVVVPVTAFRRYFAWNNDGEVRVQVDMTRMAEARDELRGLMRNLRGLDPAQKEDFDLNEQAAFRAELDPIKNGIFLGGLAITSLSLFVGAIGIMNITYVSVKERTKEIGTRKALGARRRTILLQFLTEAVSICVVGGVAGLVLTRALTAAVAAAAPAFPILFPPWLVAFALGAAMLTGIVSGFAPAWSASKLDPVEALRYE
jgi:putative ABC transport system permease protein